jgi:hypothetical protein
VICGRERPWFSERKKILLFLKKKKQKDFTFSQLKQPFQSGGGRANPRVEVCA